ncbi:MAG: alpha/beta fold hydrolase [Acidimicrobiia bacterium]
MRWLRGIGIALAAWRLLGPVITPRFPPGQQHPMRLAGRTVYVGDREFLVRESGPADGPPLVLVHGLGGSSLAEWYEMVPLLDDRFRVVLVDHRNHGLSPLARERYDVDVVADEVAGVMDAMGIGRAAVAGYSMGGAIAQVLAYRHPSRVTRLVLIGTLTHHPPFRRWSRTLGITVVRAWERLTGWGTPEVRAGYLLAVRAVSSRHARWLWEETHRRDPEVGAEAAYAMLRFDSREWVERLRPPTLVVIPSRDQLVPPAWQYELAARIPDVRALELLDARHEAPWTHPDRIAAAMREFLDHKPSRDSGAAELDG